MNLTIVTSSNPVNWCTLAITWTGTRLSRFALQLDAPVHVRTMHMRVASMVTWWSSRHACTALVHRVDRTRAGKRRVKTAWAASVSVWFSKIVSLSTRAEPWGFRLVLSGFLHVIKGYKMSIFKDVEIAPPDIIFHVTTAYNQDTSPLKCNLGVGGEWGTKERHVAKMPSEWEMTVVLRVVFACVRVRACVYLSVSLSLCLSAYLSVCKREMEGIDR